MAEAWLLSSGSYSDYSVVGLAATKEIAERIAEISRQAGGYDGIDAGEGFDILTEVPDHSLVFRAVWYAEAGESLAGSENTARNDEPRVETKVLWSLESPPYDMPENVGERPSVKVTVDRLMADTYPGTYLPTVTLTVYGTDKDAVAKTASDRRASLIAAYDATQNLDALVSR